jgi:hypothetical protein
VTPRPHPWRQTDDRRPETPAATVYLWTEAASGFLFTLMATVSSVYFFVEAGLGPFRLLILAPSWRARRCCPSPHGRGRRRDHRRLSIQIGPR